MDDTFRKHRLIWVITALLSIVLGYKEFTYSTEITDADDYGRNVAGNVQQMCIKNSACPSHLDGWVKTGEMYEWKYYGKNKVKIGYSGSKNSFQVFVRHGFAKGLTITGGVNVKLTESQWTS